MTSNWYVGSLSGEKFKSSAKKGSPRRKLPDGRTETGVPLEGENPDAVPIVEGNIELEEIEDAAPLHDVPQEVHPNEPLKAEITAEEFDKIMGDIDGEEEAQKGP